MSDVTKTALIVIANGSEEIEAVVVVDVLRRAKIQVTVAGLTGSEPVKCSRDVMIVPDVDLSDISAKFDIIVLPGGLEGAKQFCTSNMLGALLKDQESSGRLIAAICAAPTALKAHGIGLGKKLTSYPSMKATMIEGGKYNYVDDESVVIDSNLITSRGPGTAFDFALAIVEKVADLNTKQTVAKGMLLK